MEERVFFHTGEKYGLCWISEIGEVVRGSLPPGTRFVQSGEPGVGYLVQNGVKLHRAYSDQYIKRVRRRVEDRLRKDLLATLQAAGEMGIMPI